MHKDNKLLLADNGQTTYQIVIPHSASPSECHAAEELKHYLKEISGADLPILSEQEYQNGPAILLGRSKWSEPLLREDEWESLGEEGFQIFTTEDHLVIAGSRVRGTLYGVYGFLQNCLGCRWFTKTVQVIPKRTRLSLSSVNIREVPVLEYREPYYLGNLDPDWHARNFSNGYFPPLTAIHGGKMKYQPFVHTFSDLVPPEQYFAEHPEYYSEVNGVRIQERTQLCLTNEEVFQIALQQVRKWIAEDPEAKIISISQNDCFNPCTCPQCRAVDEEEGSHAGTLIRFVNRIAEEIEKDYPNILIDTLAYQYTRKPPRCVRPRKNVIIRLCSIECCFSHPLATCSKLASFEGNELVHKSFVDDLVGWGKISDRLYIWDYVTNFANYLQPFPNFAVLQKNIQFLIDNHVRGIFEEGNNSDGESGEFDQLRQYLLAKLLWNPQQDPNVIIDDFMAGYYGMAAPWMRRWFDLYNGRITPEIHMGIYDKPSAPYLDDELLKEGDRLFDAAEIAAENEDVLARVRTARLSIRFVKLSRLPTDAPDRNEQIHAFFRDVEAAGITQIQEWTPTSVSEQKMLADTQLA